MKLEELHLKQLQHENNIKFLIQNNRDVSVISLNTDILIIFSIIIITFILICVKKYKNKLYGKKNSD